jgi:hypothetical protein
MAHYFTSGGKGEKEVMGNINKDKEAVEQIVNESKETEKAHKRKHADTRHTQEEPSKKKKAKKQKQEEPNEGQVAISLQTPGLLQDRHQLFAAKDRIEHNAADVDTEDRIPLTVKTSQFHPTQGTST